MIKLKQLLYVLPGTLPDTIPDTLPDTLPDDEIIASNDCGWRRIQIV